MTALATLGVTLASCEPREPQVFHEVLVATVRRGRDPGQVPMIDTSREEGGDVRTGAPFIDSQGTIYFMDFAQSNLKIIRPAAGGTSVEVVPRPPRSAQNDTPTDGCVADDGTIFLFTDSGRLDERYVIHYRRAADRGWRRAEPLDDDAIGWIAIAAKRVPAWGSARIEINPRGEVEISDFDRRISPAIVVADRNGVLVATAWRRLPAGVLTAGGRLVTARGHTTLVSASRGQGPAAEIDVPAIFLGTDRLDNIYLRLPGPRPGGDFIRRYGPDGRLLASGQVPARPIEALLLGKGTFQVGPDGDIYQFRMTVKGLEVTRWTTRDAGR